MAVATPGENNSKTNSFVSVAHKHKHKHFCVQLAEPLQHHCELLPRTLNDFGGYNWTDTRVDFRMMDPKKNPQSHKVLPVFYMQTVPTCFSFDCESALKRRRMWFIALSITDD